ncbi:hypothetical protein C8R44DRAFT_817971 [Mycena epipterygia]|nr:hypothetical protein C8R44DRAFT_817971 [Mycena epipterygia]
MPWKKMRRMAAGRRIGIPSGCVGQRTRGSTTVWMQALREPLVKSALAWAGLWKSDSSRAGKRPL